MEILQSYYCGNVTLMTASGEDGIKAKFGFNVGKCVSTYDNIEDSVKDGISAFLLPFESDISNNAQKAIRLIRETEKKEIENWRKRMRGKNRVITMENRSVRLMMNKQLKTATFI